MSGGKTTSKTTMDPTQKGLLTANYNSANSLPGYTPYTGEFVSPLNSTETQAGGLLSGIAANNPGSANLSAAAAGANGVLGYNPSQVTAGQLSSTDLSPYMNPFTNDVINSSLATLNQQRGQQNVADNASATAANAFGGTRQAVQRALTSGQYDMNTANLVSGLNSQNYAQAQQAAGTDIGNRLNASEFNTNAGITANGQRLSAAGLLGDIGQNQFTNANTAANNLLQYGVLGQQTQTANDLAKYQDYMVPYNYALQRQQAINQALGLFPNQSTTTQKQSQGLGGILGDVGSIASLASAFI